MNYKRIIKEQYVKNMCKDLNIIYEQLDYNISDMVYLFNKIGLKTKFSCSGHNEYEYPFIMFDETVTDNKILEISELFLESNEYYGSFSKLVRSNLQYDCPEILINWCFNIEFKTDYYRDENFRNNVIRKSAKRLEFVYDFLNGYHI